MTHPTTEGKEPKTDNVKKKLAIELLARFSGNSRGTPIAKKSFVDGALWAMSEQNKQQLQLIAELDSILFEVSQVMDGWHNDGTEWSEYDESVRKKVNDFRIKYTYKP